MPNIGVLPSAKTLLIALVPDTTAPYGRHLNVSRDESTSTIALRKGSTVLAVASPTQCVIVLKDLDATTVPYVNAFAADHGQRVEKYWRTKEYRIVSATAEPITARAKVTPTFVKPDGKAIEKAYAPLIAAARAKPEPLISVTEAVALHPEIDDDLAEFVRETPGIAIPGVEHPTKVKVKSLGKDWSSIGDIIVPSDDLATLQDAWKLRQAGVPASVLITGPAGTAKTALVRAFAASLGVPFLKVDAGAIRTADDWAGAFRQDPNTKTWAHRWSPFAQVLRKGEPALILIDEFNRTESPQASNALMGLLDWTGQLLVPDASTTLHLPAGILVVATANIGPEFVGTLPIDGAVRQRFPYGIRLGYPDAKREAALITAMTGLDLAVADRLVMLGDSQRVNREDPGQYPSGNVISTRILLDIARRVTTCGTEPRKAVIATLRGQFDPGDDAALSVLVDAQFPEPIAAEEIIEEQALDEVARALAGAASSEAPLIVTGKHYFVNRYSTGGVSVRCQYHTEGSTSTTTCGLPAADPIHF